MAWVNYHSHSTYCDGKADPEDFVLAAIEKNFPAYGYSSHAPVPFNSVWNMPAVKLKNYLDEINHIKEKYAGKLQVYTGLEIDFIEGYWGRNVSLLKNILLDYFIGSVHYLDRLTDSSYFCFDGLPDAFFSHFETLYKNDARKLVTRYYHNVRSMVETDRPTIVGHMDKIKMHNIHKKYFDESEKWYKQLVNDTLDLIAEKGCIVEVNTRGYYKNNRQTLYPSEWVLKLANEKGIPLMINADAHLPQEVDAGYSYAAGILKKIGVDSLRILLDNRWTDMPFTEEGFLA